MSSAKYRPYCLGLNMRHVIALMYTVSPDEQLSSYWTDGVCIVTKYLGASTILHNLIGLDGKWHHFQNTTRSEKYAYIPYVR